MKKLLNFLFDGITFDKYVEGMYAHEYRDETTRKEIAETYIKRYKPEPNPFSHPERFDPLNPPKGWAYDPFYECWTKLDE